MNDYEHNHSPYRPDVDDILSSLDSFEDSFPCLLELGGEIVRQIHAGGYLSGRKAAAGRGW